jgi:thiamine pyrophosphate-dependent acetolactate synthase large subunit-like protein
MNTITSEDTRVLALKSDVSPIITQADAILTLTTEEDVKNATEVLSKLNKTLDRVDEEKSKILDPLKEAAKAEKARWEPLETAFKGAIDRIRGLLSSYQTAKIKAQKEEEDKILARTKEGKGNFTAETAIRKLEAVEAPQAKVTTDVGSLAFRPKDTLKITDESLIPRRYLVVDESRLLTDLKSGLTIPGAEIEVIQVPVNRR